MVICFENWWYLGWFNRFDEKQSQFFMTYVEEETFEEVEFAIGSLVSTETLK